MREIVSFLACVRFGEEEEQLVMKKIVLQVSLSTTVVRVLLLFNVLPAVMSTKRYNVFLHKGRVQKIEIMLGRRHPGSYITEMSRYF